MAIGRSVFELAERIGYLFNDTAYLENAVTHSSYSNEMRAKGMVYPSNERLEFLGDAVLQILISEYLYENFKNKSEGSLTKMRQNLVCEKTLSHIAMQIDLGEYLNIGRGEEQNGCRRRAKVLADALEAIIGAIYMDSRKFEAQGAKESVLHLFETEINEYGSILNVDYKTELQQLIEKDGAAILEYVVIDESGPEHDKKFTVEARVNNNSVGQGTAKSKKDAEQNAARVALSLFGVSK